MVATDNLVSLINEGIKKAQREELFFTELYNDSSPASGKNEFLFFVKPELTVPSNTIKTEDILNMVMGKIENFGLSIRNIKILSAKYLEKYNIIAQHYGVINKISSGAVQSLSESAKEKFKELYGKNISDVKMLGGVEFINQYPLFNPYVLDYLWQNKENKKLAGGTYCEDIKIDDEIIYVVNGFHPRQLKHFTEKGRSIVVMTLTGDLSWKDARNNFIGATNPLNAEKGSVRRELFEKKEAFGLSEVSQGLNGVHLSAGPVEALGELRRYNSDFSDEKKVKAFTDFTFGKKLYENFSKESAAKIIENANLDVNGKQVSVFDLTEEKDSLESIELLKQYLK